MGMSSARSGPDYRLLLVGSMADVDSDGFPLSTPLMFVYEWNTEVTSLVLLNCQRRRTGPVIPASETHAAAPLATGGAIRLSGNPAQITGRD